MPRLRHPAHRATACLLLAALVGLLAACSSTLAYRHADTLLLWKIDQYVGLTRDQRAMVKARLKELLAQHRQEALPQYERFLEEVKRQAADGLTRQELDWVFTRYDELRADLFARVIPDGAQLLASISDAQVRGLERALAKDWAHGERRVGETWARRVTQRTSAAVRLAKEWLGAITPEQERLLREVSPSLPDGEPVRLGYAKAWQQDLLSILRGRPDMDLLTERLEAWLLQPRAVAPDYGRLMAEMQEGVKRVVLALDATATPAQRAHALTKLQSLIDDIRSLSAS